MYWMASADKSTTVCVVVVGRESSCLSCLNDTVLKLPFLVLSVLSVQVRSCSGKPPSEIIQALAYDNSEERALGHLYLLPLREILWEQKLLNTWKGVQLNSVAPFSEHRFSN